MHFSEILLYADKLYMASAVNQHDNNSSNSIHVLADGSLSFSGQNVKCVPPWLLTKYGNNITRMDLSYNKIQSLKGLVGFTELKELILDNNELTDDLELPQLEQLETFTVNKNKIKNLKGILMKISTSFPKISYLSLLGNEACPTQLNYTDKDDKDYLKYRYCVLQFLPNLKFLDSSPVTQAERKEAKRIEKVNNVKSSSNVPESKCNVSSQEKWACPTIPSSEIQESYRKSYFGKNRVSYYGKNSEGNRFIVNEDL
ncbi:leucine-rich melanocyte differentiation-associated protein isoform X8 [Hydra vulgaris]|uniref:Leucine-rich melanocyte differentiation-associated protein isoform X8 n=1 Tax=Hydra vulgaris TaxID=6087 RepID=A0ABM4BRA1_HYDVU